MPRIYCFVEAVESNQKALTQEWVLDKEESHHLVNVLRIEVGAPVYAIDGKGGRWECRVAEVSPKKQVRLKVVKFDCTDKRGVKLTLIQAIPKGKHFEQLIRHSVELGVDCIIPIETERTEVHINKKEEERKQQKWENILKDACKQSGNTHLPYLMNVENLKNFFKKTYQAFSKNGLCLIVSLQPDALPVKALFEEKIKKGTTVENVAWLIGPEGDFTEDEYAMARKAGFIPVRLTQNILRVETAAWYALSVTRYALNER